MNIFNRFSGTAARPRKNIFISYRVQDTAGETGRLVDSLKQNFYEDQIFMDIDKIEPGVDFTEAIAKSLESCDVMLAIIGPNWLSIKDNNNQPRLQNPRDWVRLEISTALKRNIRVVPVLVDGATLPNADDLPDNLDPLLNRQAYEISNKRWKYDTDQLVQFLIRIGITPIQLPEANVVKKQRTWWQRNSWWVYLGLGFFIAIVIIGTILNNSANTQKQNNNYNNTTGTPVQKQSLTEPANNNEENVSKPARDNISAAGTWLEDQPGDKSTLVITENSGQLYVQVYALNQLMGTGSGTIKNGSLELRFSILANPVSLHAIVAKDGNHMNGTYTFESTGLTQLVTLSRIN